MPVASFVAVATFISGWNKVNEELAAGTMDEDKYQAWLGGHAMIV